MVEFRNLELLYKDVLLNISYFIRVGNGTTLLFLQGLGSTKYEYTEPLHRSEFNDFTIVCFDFPGSGKSSYPTHSSLDIIDLAEISKLVIDSLNLTDITVIGHSLGGITGLLLAHRYPTHVQRFINVEGNIAPEDAGIFSRRTASNSYDDFLETNFMQELQDEFTSLQYMGAKLYADRFRENVRPKPFYDYCVSIVKHSDSGQLMRYFTQLTIARMFMFGDANEHLSYIPSLSQYGIVVNKVPNSHHWCYLDNRDHYYSSILNFVSNSTATSM